LSVVKSSPAQSLGTKEASTHLDKLQKENWDLKHRVALQQDRVKRLDEQLEEALEEVEKSKEWKEKNEELNEALDILSKKVASSEEEMKELTDINDDLIKELELRDTGIKQRQLAIEEAAGIIQSLEMKLEATQLTVQHPSPKQDSDYFSGDAECPSPERLSKAPPPTRDLAPLPDSDYFSADTSPNMTPKTPRKMNLPATKEKQSQLERARETGASFNREVGLRTAASKESLLSTFLDPPDLPAPKPHSRMLRRKTPTPDLQTIQQSKMQEPLFEATRSTGTPPWSHSRPLRNLYEQGEFNRQIHAGTPVLRIGSTPSVTVASPDGSTVDDILSTRSASHAHSPATTVSDSALPTPQSRPQTLRPPHSIPSNPSPVNYSAWPRKYPEWPPSASLTNRDVLFHGEGLHKMSPGSPPKDHRHLRSASTTHADANNQPQRPPPLQRAGTTTSTLSVPRPAGLDRRRTLR